MSTLSVATSGVPPPVNTTAPTSTPSPIPLPNWDNAEVEKRLKENAEALKEWSALLDKADIAAAKNEDVPQSDINQHNALVLSAIVTVTALTVLFAEKKIARELGYHGQDGTVSDKTEEACH